MHDSALISVASRRASRNGEAASRGTTERYWPKHPEVITL